MYFWPCLDTEENLLRLLVEGDVVADLVEVVGSQGGEQRSYYYEGEKSEFDVVFNLLFSADSDLVVEPFFAWVPARGLAGVLGILAECDI